ncbi:MAG: hypothetical protein Kow0010_19810 [Dehalococcoidia bacterium]
MGAAGEHYRALQASEARYRDLFENASDMMYTTDLDGNFTSGNRALREALGVSPEQLLSLNIRDILGPEEYARAIAMTQRKLLQGDPVTKYELWITPPNAAPMLVELHTRLILEDGKPIGVQGSARDVTEARRTAEALARSEESLRQAQQIARIGNWDWDMVHNTLTWSDEIYRIFGLPPGEWGATYEAFLERVHPDDRALVEHAVQAAIEDRAPYSVHHRIIRFDNGETRIVHELGEVTFDQDGRPVRMIGTVQDVTELKRAEQALRESEEHLRTILSNAPVIIYALDADGVFTFYEGAGLEGLGFKPGERIGQRIWDLDDHPPPAESSVSAGLSPARWLATSSSGGGRPCRSSTRRRSTRPARLRVSSPSCST